MSDQKNMLLAIGLALLVLLGWDYFIVAPQREAAQQTHATVEAPADGALPAAPDATSDTAPEAGDTAAALPAGSMARSVAVAQGARLRIDTPRLEGSILLTGARFDDLTLKDYWETVARTDNIHLFSPANTPSAYFVEFGWSAGAGAAVDLPDETTRWQASAPVLTPDQPVELRWSNAQGLTFIRRITVDKDYLFTVEQRVENSGEGTWRLFPYAKALRTWEAHGRSFYVVHEGALGVIDGSLKEVSYKDLQDDKRQDFNSTGGWIGLADKYWMTALVPDQARPFSARFNYAERGRPEYAVSFLEEGQTLAPGGHIEVVNRFFAGAKEVKLVERYGERYGITKFDLTIDWGWFYFLTKPIFYGLDVFNRLLGNFGLAIIALTVAIKLLLFPLANKSYESLGRMKTMQPRMKELQERYKEDRARLQQEMAALFKKEGVNPLAGCLPILIQMPIFFALYKVLFVTIEMRHAPFYLWIRDLSAPDPLTPVNFFGLLPFDPPTFLAIGVLPIVMGITMWLQQKLNPPPTDPIQGQVMKALPIVFTIIMAPFAAGLVIYWTANNILSIAQQWVIQRRIEARG
ncbi:MAG: membrane protein insertase YidC [Pseudomonadota bacterium]